MTANFDHVNVLLFVAIVLSPKRYNTKLALTRIGTAHLQALVLGTDDTSCNNTICMSIYRGYFITLRRPKVLVFEIPYSCF